ncbi:N-acetylneuraminate lyase [Blautia sp.]|uniref:N-acetylneuraminate lyase n=1 Tax=Blautia sp. TaxID=1955243 RepID=UPI003D8E14BC
MNRTTICRKDLMNTLNNNIFKKIFSALELPMNSDETLNMEMLSKLIEYELSIGVEGFYCMGSSGEALLLSLEERKNALEQILKIVDKRVPVIAHVGTVRTEDAICLARHAAAAGADAISMIPPYYYKFNMDEIITYYENIIQAVPEIGVIVYNIPQFTGIEFNKDNAGRLLSNKRVIGVKHTSNNLYALERMRSAYPDKVFFNGFDEQFTGALAMGAEATIGTTVNVFAPLFIKARDLFYSGKVSEALKIQSEINYCVEEMCKVGIFSAVKYILTKRGIVSGNCRRPFHPLSSEECLQIDKLICQYDSYFQKLQ